MKIKLSKSQWEGIGKKAGWMRKAITDDINSDFQERDPIIQFDDYVFNKDSDFGRYVSSIEEGVKAMRLAKSEEERQIIAKRIPHFILFTGEAGSGKTVWAEALADLLKIRIEKIDLDRLMSMWVENLENYVGQLIRNILSKKNIVILMEGIDRHSDVNNNPPFPVIADVLTKNNESLIRNNTFVIMTANSIPTSILPLIKIMRGNVYHQEY